MHKKISFLIIYFIFRSLFTIPSRFSDVAVAAFVPSSPFLVSLSHLAKTHPTSAARYPYSSAHSTAAALASYFVADLVVAAVVAHSAAGLCFPLSPLFADLGFDLDFADPTTISALMPNYIASHHLSNSGEAIASTSPRLSHTLYYS